MVDIEAIKRRIAQLNGTAKSGSNVWWRPKKAGEYKVRIVPWQDNGGQPFKEVWYYKGIGKKNAKGWAPFPMPTLHQYKKPDPIQELINHLREEDAEGNREILKKLYPKMTVIVPVIVRGEESEGVRLWAITDIKKVYQQLLGFFVDAEVLEETPDYTDVRCGFDLKVTLSESTRMFNGKPVLDWTVATAKKTSPLSTDEKQIESWLKSIPSLSDVDPAPTYEEMKKRLEDWFEDGAGTAVAASDDTATERGGGDDDSKDLSRLADGLKEEEKKPAPKPAKEKPEKAEAAPKKEEEAPKPASKPAKDKTAKSSAESPDDKLSAMFQQLEEES